MVVPCLNLQNQLFDTKKISHLRLEMTLIRHALSEYANSD